MKHYTDTISAPLAIKLIRKNLIDKIRGSWTVPSYAETFDILLSKGICVYVKPLYLNNGELKGWQPYYGHCGMNMRPTWHEAAEKAIEKALTLI